MRIIKRGYIPKYEYIQTCNKCGTVFAAGENEYKRSSYREGNPPIIQCPVCGNIVDWSEEHKILKGTNPNSKPISPTDEVDKLYPDNTELQDAWLSGWDYCRDYVQKNYNIKI